MADTPAKEWVEVDQLTRDAGVHHDLWFANGAEGTIQSILDTVARTLGDCKKAVLAQRKLSGDLGPDGNRRYRWREVSKVDVRLDVWDVPG